MITALAPSHAARLLLVAARRAGTLRALYDPDQPRDDGGRWSGGSSTTTKQLDNKFPRASGSVDGREFTTDVPNVGSIRSSLDSYEVLPGIREVKVSDFEASGAPKFYSKSEQERTERLAEAIKQSGRITPLIVVIDKEKSPYILEGGHRFDALKMNGAKSFPALVVVDTGEVEIRGAEFNPDQPRDEQGQWTGGGGEHETLRLYTQSGGTYREVNDGLREDKDMSSHETVTLLDKTFKEQSEPAPPVVYRGMSGYEPEELGLVEGATFTDKGFVSTAAVKADAMKFATHGQMKLSGEAVGIIFKINTGKAPALNMSRYSRYGESEHLLNRGTTFKVTKVTEGYPGEKLAVVHMSVVK